MVKKRNEKLFQSTYKQKGERGKNEETYTTPGPNDLIELPALITSNNPSDETKRKFPESPSFMIKLFTSKLSRAIALTTALIESLSRILHRKSFVTIADVIIFSVLAFEKKKKLEKSPHSFEARKIILTLCLLETF